MRAEEFFLSEIAEGVGAEQALRVFGDTLRRLIEATLRRADALAEDGKLGRDEAYPLLLEAVTLRRIVNRLTQKVTRAQNARAAVAEAKQPGDREPPRE